MSMSPADDDKLTRILVGVQSTKDSVDHLKGTVTEIKEQIKGSVTKSECRERHNTVNTVMTTLDTSLKEIKGDVKHIRSNTRETKTVTPDGSGTEDKVKDLSRKTVTFWIGSILGILAILGASWRIAVYFASIDQALAQTAQVIKKELKDKPKVIYVRVPSDASYGVIDDEK